MPFITKVGSAAARAYGWLATTVSVAVNDAYFYLVSLLLSTTSTNGAQNNTFLDSSPNNFTITRNGNTTQGSFSPFSQTGWSNYFDGTGDFLSVNMSSVSLTGDFTWESWVYETGGTNYGTILGWRNPAPWTGFIIQRNNGANNLLAVINQTGITLTQTSGTYVKNAWVHVALVRSGSTITLYVNGTSVASGTLAGTIAPGASYWTGSDPQNNVAAVQFGGCLSNQRLVNGTAVYTANFTPPTAPLTPIANTSLLTCNSQSIVDTGPYKFTITRNGDTRATANGPFAPSVSTPTSYSGWFDGSGDYLTTPASSALTFGTGDFTVEAWIYPQSSSGTQGICGVSVSGSAGDLTIFYNLAAGKVSINSYGGTRIDSITSVPLNVWTHIAFARQSGTTRVFINGALDNSATMTDNFTKTIAVVGRSYSSLNQEYFTGSISNLRLVKGTAVYTSNFTPPTAPLTAITNTSLLTCQNATFIDNSTNAFALTVFGNAQPRTLNPFGYTTTQPASYVASPTPTSYSGQFDGNGDYLALPDSSNLELGSASFTVEMWINTQSGTQYTTLYSRTPVTFASGCWTLLINNASATAGDIAFYAADNSNAFPLLLTTGVNIRDAAWHHIALVRNASAWTIYVDGVSRASATWAGTVADLASGPNIARDQFYGRYYAGCISNLRVVKGTAVYTSNFTPPTAPLTAISDTQLLTCQNATFIDNSSNAFTVTANGNAQTNANNPFGYTTTGVIGGSGYFDGTGDYLSIADNAALDMGSSNFTMECWFYPLVTPNGNLFAKRSSSAVYGGAMVIFSSTLTPTIYATTTGSTWEVIKTSTVGCVLNSWNHIAFTRSSTTWTIFVNGVSGGSVTVSGTIPDNTAAFTVGAGAADGSSPISQSYISDAQVIKGTALYTSAFAPPPAPLTPVAGTSLLLNYTNAGIYDAASQTLLETVGNAQVSTTQAKWGSTAVAFDGTGDWLLPPLSPPQRLTIGTGDFTIEFWVYFDSGATATRYLIDWRPSGTEGVYPTIYTDGSSVLRYYVSSATRITGSALSATTWTHIAVARSGTSTRMFVNGTQVGSTYTDSNNYLGPASRPVIGTAGLSLGTGSFSGYMDDLRITVGYARYTSNFTPPSAAFPTQ